MDQRGSRTDLIFFALDRSLAQDDATLTLIEGEQMHRGLLLALMSERATYGFAIHRHMREPLFLFLCLQAAGFAPTLFHGSCFQQHACYHRDELLRIAAS